MWTNQLKEYFTLLHILFTTCFHDCFNKDSSNFLHTEHIILVDKDKHIRGVYNGTLQLEAQQLIADIRELEKE